MKQFTWENDPSNFLGDSYESDFRNLPDQGEADKVCWSGSHWPMRHVLVASRYGYGDDSSLGSWDDSTGYFTEYTYSQSAAKVNQPNEYKGNIVREENLDEDLVATKAKLDEVTLTRSPAEKYDILVGDTQTFSLTNWMLQESSYYALDGDIPYWYGICHGWAPASYMFPEPTKPVTLIAADD